jgi:hypothetical protein
MREETQIEMFIRTLKTMLDTERDIRHTGQLRQSRAIAKSYIAAFPGASEESLTQPEWPSWDGGSEQAAVQLMQSD